MLRLPHPLTGEALEELNEQLAAEVALPDPDDIPITLREGVEHNIGRIRVVVVRHVWKQKPRFKLLGPAERPAPFVIPERRRRRKVKAG